MTTLWRIASRTRHTPAHKVVYQRDDVVATACNWVPTVRGLLVGEAEVRALECHICRRCRLGGLT